MLAVIEGSLGGAVLLAFYLFLAVKGQYIQRPMVYRFGLLGFVLIFIGALVGHGQDGSRLGGLICEGLGQLLALLCLVVACTDSFLPAVDSYIAAKVDRERMGQRLDPSKDKPKE
jgi:hypothetical protein